MSTIVTRAGKGSPLTHTEVDNNFTNLNTDKLQSGNTAASLAITSADINGGTIDGTSIGSGSASTGAFTTLSASSTVSGTGFSTYLASPPAIGGTTPSTGAFTTLSATGVATVSAGSVSAPAITTTGDTNTGIFFPAADTIAFSEGGAEAMRIDSSGNVGIGTSSPSGKLNVSGATVISRITGTDGIGILRYNDGSSDVAQLAIAGGETLLDYNGPLKFRSGINGSERMRIDSSGNLLVNTTANFAGAGAKIAISTDTGAASGTSIKDTGTTYGANYQYITFVNAAGTNIAAIQHNASTTVNYATSSDARLKKDLGVAISTEVIDNIIIHNFEWKEDGRIDRGVFAQEANEIKPSAISVGTDELTESGELLKPWGVDYSKFVPELIVYCQQLKKTAQEQQAIITEQANAINALEARLTALEIK